MGDGDGPGDFSNRTATGAMQCKHPARRTSESQGGSGHE